MHLNSRLIVFSFLPISMILGNLMINLNIIILSILLIAKSFNKKDWKWCEEKNFKLLIIFYLYLVFNSLFNLYHDSSLGYDGIIRSMGFIKFILLAYAFKILIKDNKELDRIIFNWLLIVLIVIFDIFFEKIFGHNIFGFKSLDGTRIISFFYDESIAGGFVLCFGFIISSYFFTSEKNIKKIFFNILFLLIPLTIFITGERSNFIKSVLIFSLILYFVEEKFLILNKKKLLIILISSFFLGMFLSKTVFIKQTEVFKRIFDIENPTSFNDRFKNIKYFAHYDAAWEIFKDYPINGVGSKNFRYKCSKEIYLNPNLVHSVHRCSTHPHQIHFEFLSEHGIIGYLLFFYIILSFIIKNLALLKFNQKIFFKTQNIYLFIFLIPLLPGGAVFSTVNGFMFWLIFSLANMKN